MGVERSKILSSLQEPKDLVHQTPFQYVGVFSGLSGSENGHFTWRIHTGFMVKNKILKKLELLWV